jgi:hypothetical protein
LRGGVKAEPGVKVEDEIKVKKDLLALLVLLACVGGGRPRTRTVSGRRRGGGRRDAESQSVRDLHNLPSSQLSQPDLPYFDCGTALEAPEPVPEAQLLSSSEESDSVSSIFLRFWFFLPASAEDDLAREH